MSGRVSPSAGGSGGGAAARTPSPAAAAAAAAADGDADDLLSLGEHCSKADCGALDFLPFRCDACKRSFCLEHRSYAAHACAAAAPGRELLVIVCPLCSTSVQLRPGEAPDAAFDRHTRAGGGCDPRNYAAARERARRVCGAPRCKEKLTAVNTYECRACRRAVCLRHRHADDHACAGGGGGGATRLGASLAAANGGGGGGLLQQLWGAASAAATSVVVPPAAMQQQAQRRQQAQQQQQQRARTQQAQQQQLDSYRQQQQQRYQRQQVPPPGAGTGGAAAGAAAPAHDFACHRCGMGFADPVALVEHDSVCAGGGGGGGGGGSGRGRSGSGGRGPCIMS